MIEDRFSMDSRSAVGRGVPSAPRSLAALLALLPLALAASVPLRWTVETSRVQPAVLDVVRGETVALEASLASYGRPLDMSGRPVAILWQTNGMGNAWWSAPATASSNRVSAVFTPAMDPGAQSVTGFIGTTGDIYRAAFQLRFRHGPGAIPNALPLPQPVIDFSRVSVLNPPWLDKAGGDVTGDLVVDGVLQVGGSYLYAASDIYASGDCGGSTVTGGDVKLRNSDMGEPMIELGGMSNIRYVPAAGAIIFGLYDTTFALSPNGDLSGVDHNIAMKGDTAGYRMIVPGTVSDVRVQNKSITVVNASSHVVIRPPVALTVDDTRYAREFAVWVNLKSGGSVEWYKGTSTTGFGSIIYGDIPYMEEGRSYIVWWKEIYRDMWLRKCEELVQADSYDAEVAYLQSTGDTWIDTGIYANATTEITLDYKLDSTSDGRGVFGYYQNLNNFYLYTKDGKYQSGLKIVGDTTRTLDTNRHVAYLGKGKFKLDGTVVRDFGSVASFGTSQPIALLSILKSDGTTYPGASMKLYSVVIRNNDTRVLDAIPVRVGNVGYLSDRVSGRLLGCQPPGSFIVGPDKN